MARRARAVRHTKGRDKDERASTKTARLASDRRWRRAERPAGWPSGFQQTEGVRFDAMLAAPVLACGQSSVMLQGQGSSLLRTSGDGANGPSRADTCVLAAALRRGWRPGDGEDGWMEPGGVVFALAAGAQPKLPFDFFVLVQRTGASACVCRASACICWCLFRREEKEEKTEVVDDVMNKGRA